MTNSGRCRYCRAPLAYQVQCSLLGEPEALVPVEVRRCVTAPATFCEVETAGDRMISDLAKRNSRRRNFKR